MKKRITRRVIIRHSDKKDTSLKRFLLGLFRFLLYGMVGVFAEVCLYTIVKVGRQLPLISWAFKFQWKVDKSLNLSAIWNVPVKTFFGQCSLWMFLVYGFCAFFVIEKIYRETFHKSWILRGILYAFSILFFEFISGFVAYWITGYKIWYYDDALNVLHMTSLYTLPMWFVTGMLVETLYRELMSKKVKASIESEINKSLRNV